MRETVEPRYIEAEPGRVYDLVRLRQALVRGLLVEVAEYPEDAGKVAERMRLVARAGLFMVGPDELGFMDAFAPEDGSAVHIGGVSMSSVLAQGVKRGTR